MTLTWRAALLSVIAGGEAKLIETHKKLRPRPLSQTQDQLPLHGDGRRWAWLRRGTKRDGRNAFGTGFKVPPRLAWRMMASSRRNEAVPRRQFVAVNGGRRNSLCPGRVWFVMKEQSCIDRLASSAVLCIWESSATLSCLMHCRLLRGLSWVAQNSHIQAYEPMSVHGTVVFTDGSDSTR